MRACARQYISCDVSIGRKFGLLSHTENLRHNLRSTYSVLAKKFDMSYITIYIAFKNQTMRLNIFSTSVLVKAMTAGLPCGHFVGKLPFSST